MNRRLALRILGWTALLGADALLFGYSAHWPRTWGW